jgi:predicted  nucleic acid-binding Zn-ribbon protein
MEKTVKARDAAIARHDEEKRQLAARILDLERQCAELTGRRKEREEAYDELQKKVAAHFAETEQLKAEYANRLKEAEHAANHAVDRQRHIESLERGIKRRDESIEALSTELEQSKGSVAELTTGQTKLGKRVEELEKGLTDRSQQVQVLREDLRMSHDQLRLAQQQLSDRTAQLASTQEALDQKSRHIERLTDDFHAAQKDAVQARNELGALDAHAIELGRLRSEAVAEVESLKNELSAQQDLVASLETELRAKQATADLLERSVDRITDLGASLAALDEQMSGGGGDDGLGIEKSSLHLADFVATLAADDRLAAAAPEANEAGEELLSMDLLLDDDRDQNVVDIGERTQAEAGRKLVVTIDGEAFDFPLVKRHMTIGRGHGSDIRIASHFVSRVHAKISTSGVATVIEDAGSKNGLIVNSERVRSRVLRDGDVVSLGDDLNLRFVDATH